MKANKEKVQLSFRKEGNGAAAVMGSCEVDGNAVFKHAVKFLHPWSEFLAPGEQRSSPSLHIQGKHCRTQ